MLSETLGKWHFWLFVIGFHLTFDSMHVPGLLGMPRRILYLRGRPRLGDLEPDRQRSAPCSRSPAFSVFVFNLVRSYYRGEIAGNDPWDAWTLEWATRRRRRSYNFAIDPTVTAAGRCGT